MLTKDFREQKHPRQQQQQQQRRRNQDIQPESICRHHDHGKDDDHDQSAALGDDRSQHDEQPIYRSLAPNSDAGHDESLIWNFEIIVPQERPRLHEATMRRQRGAGSDHLRESSYSVMIITTLNA